MSCWKRSRINPYVSNADFQPTHRQTVQKEIEAFCPRGCRPAHLQSGSRSLSGTHLGRPTHSTAARFHKREPATWIALPEHLGKRHRYSSHLIPCVLGMTQSRSLTEWCSSAGSDRSLHTPFPEQPCCRPGRLLTEQNVLTGSAGWLCGGHLQTPSSRRK